MLFRKGTSRVSVEQQTTSHLSRAPAHVHHSQSSKPQSEVPFFFVPFVYLDLIKCLWILTFLFLSLASTRSLVCLFLMKIIFTIVFDIEKCGIVRNKRVLGREKKKKRNFCLLIWNFMLSNFTMEANWYARHTERLFLITRLRDLVRNGNETEWDGGEKKKVFAVC